VINKRVGVFLVTERFGSTFLLVGATTKEIGVETDVRLSLVGEIEPCEGSKVACATNIVGIESAVEGVSCRGTGLTTSTVGIPGGVVTRELSVTGLVSCIREGTPDAASKFVGFGDWSIVSVAAVPRPIRAPDSA
jgi:hypothetical protein